MDSLPFSDKSGIVLATKKITIPGFDNAYNASIAPNDDGSFSLSFRYDKRMRNKHHVEKIKYYQEAFIGIVDLDSNLSPIPGSVRTIDTGSAFSEDARLFKMESDYYLIYNELEKLNDFNCHTMRISKLNKEKTKIDWTARLEQNLSVIEKNWVPFEITNEKGEKRVAFEYFINPQKVLIATDEKISTLKADIYPSQEVLRSLIWERKWGSLRGGTPAYLVDGQYLAFFHTLYRRSNNKKMAWYFMGAYTDRKSVV